ncbi:hypothetical protein GGF50DRAFT_67680 [Schizophyllum commune]
MSTGAGSSRRSRKRQKSDEDDIVRHRRHRATVVEMSSDSRRSRATTTHISAPRVAPPPPLPLSPSPLNGPVNSEPHEDFSFEQGDAFFDRYRDPQDPIRETELNFERLESDAEWEGLRSEYLDELLRYEGRGGQTRCRRCGSDDALYRCRDQCTGHWLHCRGCIVEVHKLTPLHWLEEWNATQQCFRRASLKRLGQVVQLGHPPGEHCVQPIAAHSDFTVIHTNGIHLVAVRFCGCGRGAPTHRQQLLRAGWWPGSIKNPQTAVTISCLRQFHKLNACGKISVYEYYRSVERLTDNTGTQSLPEKRRVFGNVVNQFRHTCMLMRAGRGHVVDGVNTTPAGGLALRCLACPEPGRNLPDDWEQAGPDKSFLYRKFVAQDANFRLANAMRSNKARNPPFGNGWGYFVRRGPYLDHVRSFATEQDISSCSGFAAVFLANLKRVRGLRATGVAAVICSRHNMFLPNGIGDLQKGERFCNMTYVLASALAHERVRHVVYSYDIACIFDKNLKARIEALPDELQTRIAELVFSFFVPNFHLPAHRAPCHAPYSFHFGPGVGRTHGETVEENWFMMNKAAAQTKPMGPGTRQLTLEDIAGCQNHESEISMGRLLPRRLVRTIQSFMNSFTEFEQLRDGIKQRNAALIDEWLTLERQWQENRTTMPCPYEHTAVGRFLKDTELLLHQQETQHTADGTAVVQEVTITVFVKLGIDTQHFQRLLALELKTMGAEPTSSQQLAVIKKRAKLRKSIEKFRAWQRIYMPSLADHLSAAERDTYNKAVDEVESMRLFLPFELTNTAREAVCAPGVVKTEIALCVAEAEQSLEDLRRALRLKTATNQFRQANVRHIGMATRAHTAFDKIAKRVHIAKARYRFARNCLLRLQGPGDWERRLRPLEDEDVWALNERALNAEELVERDRARALGHDVDWSVDDTVVLAGVLNAGEGSRRLSWIWYLDPGQAAVTEGNLNEALRVEFLKSKARRDRDREEILLLLEEMRRVIASLDHDAQEWVQRAHARAGCDTALADGLCSYAMEQAALRSERAAVLDSKWENVRRAARLALDLLFS